MERTQAMALWGMEEWMCRLVRLYCLEQPSEKEAAAWFSEIELEALPPEARCMAAALAARLDDCGVPPGLVPRLQGVMKYGHTLNAGMAAGLCFLGRLFRDAGIPVTLYGGTAVHLGCPNPPRRHLWNMEITVPEPDFPRAAALAEQAGFAVTQTPYSATARRGNTQCVILYKGKGDIRDPRTLTVSGIPFEMPGSGGLLADLAEGVYLLLTRREPRGMPIPRIMDLHCVLGDSPDWEGAAAAAKKRGTAPVVRLVLELYAALVPGSGVEEQLPLFGSGKQTAKLSRLLLEYRALPAGGSRIRRQWLLARISGGGDSLGTPGRFAQAAGRWLIRKFTGDR